MIHFFGGKILRDFGVRFRHERVHRRGVAGGGAQDFRGECGPAMQPFTEQQDVFGGIIGITKVREVEPRGLALENGREGSVPEFEVHVRWRSGGHNEGIAFDAYARGIADECYVFRLVEVADVMRSMAGCVDDFEFARAERKGLATFEDPETFLWDGEVIAKKDLQVIGPKASGAGEKFGRIDHVRSAFGVDINGKARIFADERAGGAGVVQMNVGKKDGVEIANSDATNVEGLPQSFERGARARVDDGAMAVRLEKRGCDGVRAPHPEIVEGGDRVHRGG